MDVDVSTEVICPSCNLPLKQVQVRDQNIWTCESCSGRAVTVELLRRMFTPASINPLWLHAMRHEGLSGRACPQCRRPMLQVHVSDQAGIDVDVCPHCHFVWFDRGELESLPPLPRPPSDGLSQPQREALAMMKVEALAEHARGTDFDSVPPDTWWQWIAAVCGMPVEFDAPAEERRPWWTWALAVLMILATALAFPHLRETVQAFGLIPAQATRLNGLTFLTSFFLHAGVFHLIGNIYFLVVFGDNVEDFLRPVKYLGLVVLAAFVGDVAHIAIDPHSQVPSVGASGGIAGIITFYALQFPKVRLEFLFRWGFVYFRWIRLPAWFALVLWVLFQFFGTWEQIAGLSSVSAVAHLGGAATGLVLWSFWRKRGPTIQSADQGL